MSKNSLKLSFVFSIIAYLSCCFYLLVVDDGGKLNINTAAAVVLTIFFTAFILAPSLKSFKSESNPLKVYTLLVNSVATILTAIGFISLTP